MLPVLPDAIISQGKAGLAKTQNVKAQHVKYRRILLKLSGEAFSGEAEYGIDPKILSTISKEVKRVKQHPVDVAIVIGGGNIFRGLPASKEGLDRATGDYMGMLATVINALALQDSLERHGVPCRVQVSLEMRAVAEPYIRRRAIRHMEKGRVVIFAGGTGNPYFSTDTTAALRAAEIGAQVILKATKVDGVYSADPFKEPKAKRYKNLRYLDMLNKRLQVMDSTAVSLCMDNKIPIIVFDLKKPGNVEQVVLGKVVGTLVN